MTKTSLPKTSFKEGSIQNQTRRSSPKTRSYCSESPKRQKGNSDVLVSAVISKYLLTHLHHVLQRAEYAALKENRQSQAVNFAELRKVLCMDARSMQDASAVGMRDSDVEKVYDSQMRRNAA